MTPAARAATLKALAGGGTVAQALRGAYRGRMGRAWGDLAASVAEDTELRAAVSAADAREQAGARPKALADPAPAVLAPRGDSTAGGHAGKGQDAAAHAPTSAPPSPVLGVADPPGAGAAEGVDDPSPLGPPEPAPRWATLRTEVSGVEGGRGEDEPDSSAGAAHAAERGADRGRDCVRDDGAGTPPSVADGARGGGPGDADGYRGRRTLEEVAGVGDVRAAARAMFPREADDHFRMLLWISYRRTLAGMHAIDPMWLDALRAFYATGKPLMVARKGLRAGGSVTACCAVLNDALFTVRDLDPGTVGVVPIMSSSRDEATDRFYTIRRVLHAIGVAPAKAKDDDFDDQVLDDGVGSTYKSRSGLSGGGIIQLEDSGGHTIEIRILPALRRAAVGYTGVGFFLDETDLWPADAELHRNPADLVISDVLKRITTQPTARGYIFSASYHAESAHSRRIDMGDTSAQYIMRLGDIGAARDAKARHELAAQIGSADPRLIDPADPMSPDLPAWVYNPTKSPIARCYQLADDDISKMLGLYAGRAAENASARAGPFHRVAFARPRVNGVVALSCVGIATDGRAWAVVSAVAHSDGRILVLSYSAPSTAYAAMVDMLIALSRVGASVVATPDASRARAEWAAFSQGGATQRHAFVESAANVAPLRTLYDREWLTHAQPLALEADILATPADGDAPVSVLALASCVARLVRMTQLLCPGDAPEAPPAPAPHGSVIVAEQRSIQFRATDATGRRHYG